MFTPLGLMNKPMSYCNIFYCNMLRSKKNIYPGVKVNRRSPQGSPSLTGLIVGVTGGFGTGKTFVSNTFRKLGASLIDADRITHSLLVRGSIVYGKIVSKFGQDILNKNGSINRKRLADIVFDNRKKLSSYLEIIHPEIIEIIRQQIKKTIRIYKKSKIIILDAPLLIETGLNLIVDELVVVKTNKEIQLLRLKNKFGTDKTNILKRIRFQLPLSKKLRLADYIIDNNGTQKQTVQQVRQIWEKLLEIVDSR